MGRGGGGGWLQPEAEHRHQSDPARRSRLTHGPGQWNSNAPMSYAAPWGRLVPRKSFVTYGRVTPASMAGLPVTSWKSTPNALTSFGSILSRLLERVTPAPFPSAAVPPIVRLYSTITLEAAPLANQTPAVRG